MGRWSLKGQGPREKVSTRSFSRPAREMSGNPGQEERFWRVSGGKGEGLIMHVGKVEEEREEEGAKPCLIEE